MIELLAPAKVNLCLRVFGKTDTGLHNLDSVVVFCQFGDKIRIRLAEKDSVIISGPFAPMLAATKSADNLVTTARDAFRDNVRDNGGKCGSVAIHLEKHIPVGAGLGGGSADAAAVLRGLNKLATTPLPHETQFALAADLGSDVPVCLAATPHRVIGTGDAIHQLDDIHAGALLLVNPLVPLSTAAVFKQLAPPYNQALPEITENNAVHLSGYGNDLEAVATRLVPEITDILQRFRQMPSCHAAQMSGSGASCFGIFDDLADATAACTEFQQAGYWTKPTRLSPANTPASGISP
jgi:4-diphosphocytidyl-2-C-methyl-D-erythritol kinase